MSDNWVVQNLENALETWNSKLSEIWQLLTTSPQQFKGGSIWSVIKRLREVLCYLSETQKRRVFKYFFYNKTLEKIADEEGVDFTSVRESVNSAIKKLRKFF